MSIITVPPIEIQTCATDVPTIPPWFAEVVVLASHFTQQGCRHELSGGSGRRRRRRRLPPKINLLLSRLDEAQRRWYVAIEADRIGHGGDQLLSQITGMDAQTIRRGRAELATSLAEHPPTRVRQPGGERPRIEKKTPKS